MITFQKVPMGSYDINSGQITGGPEIPQRQPAPDIGVPVDSFHSQVMQAASSKVPVEHINAAIDLHPSITNKPLAKSMAEGIYKIMGQAQMERRNHQEPMVRPKGDTYNDDVGAGALTPINSHAGTGNPNLHYDKQGRVYYMEPKTQMPRPTLI